MKRKLFICVMAAALLLTACGTNADNPTASTTPSSSSTQATQPTDVSIPAQIIDSTYTVNDSAGIATGTFMLHTLQVAAHKGNASSITVVRTNPDQTQTEIQIQYDPEEKAFTYQADGKSLTFSYMISTRHAVGSGASFYELFLLSNKPNATYSDALGANPSAVVVYANYVGLADLAESYGTAPTLFLHEAISPYELERGFYLENSFFLVDSIENDLWYPTTNSSVTAYRYDYTGKLLSTTDVPGAVSNRQFYELSDGGFLMTYDAKSDTLIKQPALARCSSDGTVLWSCDLPLSLTISPFPCATDDAIYCLGVVGDVSNRNIAVVKLSMDGALLVEKQFKGNKTSTPYGIEVVENSIRIYGLSSSTEGDFPYLGEFQVHIDSELNITSGERIGGIGTYAIRGHLNGKPVQANDPILNYQSSDVLPDVTEEPEDLQVVRIFTYEDGYVIIRKYTPDADIRSDSGLIGNQYDYTQLIFTCYNAASISKWQFVTPIYLS